MARRKPAPAPNHNTISDQLRAIIKARSTTAYELGMAIGTSPSVISRFLSGERGLTLDTVDRIGHHYGLRLVEGGRRRGRAARVESPR